MRRHHSTLLGLATVLVAFAAGLGLFLFLSQDQGADRPSATAGSAAGAPSAATARASTPDRIQRLRTALKADPGRAEGWAALAGAYLQRVRETGDAGDYLRAEAALDRGARIDAGNVNVLTERAVLAAARHDFRGALRLARDARRANPELVRPTGILVDALVELGRYDAARDALQEMVDRKPNLDSYARVSYFRELGGDLDGGIEAMRLAVSAGGEAPENAAYTATLLGSLELQRGRIAAARRQFGQALARFPGYPAAQAGLARVAVATGDLPVAVERQRAVVDRLPLPEHVIALGELERASGQRAAARDTFDLVRVQQDLLGDAGVNSDVELALFESDHGDRGRGLRLARRAWAAAPSVRSADAVGWALTRSGRAREGWTWARRALRLGTRDATFLFHAGLAARAAGRPDDARRLLRASLRDNPRFSALRAPQARRALEAL